MNKIKNYFKMLLIPLMIVMIMASCDDRVGVTTPTVVTIPTVSSTSPANAATAVAFGSNITATFSEAMNSSSITTATFTLMQGTSFVSGTVSYTGTTATFRPSSNLTANTLYTATVTTGAMNSQGSALANNYVWSFTTGAAAVVIPPNVSSTDPANAATGVALNQKIAATFSVAMDATTITASTFTLTQGTTPVSGLVSYSGITAIFAPSSPLAANTAYTVTITTGAKNLAGVALANNYVWSFTTGAAAVVTPPTVSLTDPLNAATGVALNQKISATFSKTMDATTIQTSTFSLTQGTTTVSGFVSYSGTTAIFSPASNLAASTLYTATITTGAKDLAGNALANNYVWSFTTGSATVVTPPTVILTDPLNVATGVPLNQKIAATFNRTMDASTFTTPTFILTQGTTSITGFVSYSGTTAIFAPASQLAPNTVYTATITTAAKDLAGNALANNYVWSFTTGAAVVIVPPTVISTDPANGVTGVSLAKQVTAIFSKTMDASTITNATFILKQGNTSVSGFVSYSGTTAIFAPLSNLAASTLYTATITTGAKDLAGNALANNYVWSFTTGAAVVIVPPTVVSTDPVDGATGVVLNKQVTATFSKTMDASTITTATFTLMRNQGSTFVSGTVSYAGTTATYTLLSNLEQNQVYTATITTGAKDLAGTSLTSNYVWSFTTGIGVVNPPTVNLGAAASFGGFGGSAGMTNQGIFTVVNGDIGTTAASTLITGFHDTGGNVFTETPLNIGAVNGTINCAPPAPGTATKLAKAQQALADATTAFNYLAGLPGGPDPGAGELGGLVLAPGTYTASAGTFKITSNDLTLDAQNNADAIWVFQMAQSLTVGKAGQPRSIILVNGAQAKNIYWQVGSAATINGAGGGTMAGTIISYSGVTFSTAGNVTLTRLNGRALSLVASVTLVNTIVNVQ